MNRHSVAPNQRIPRSPQALYDDLVTLTRFHLPPAWSSRLLICVIGGAASLSPGGAQPPPHSLAALLDGSAFVRIPAGEFVMGSAGGNADEQPPHRVRIANGFELGKYEVTQAQWETVMRNPHARPDVSVQVNPSRFKGADRPVENVSWNAVQEFLKALSTRDTSHDYRLPTEAEWEYAARAGAEGEPADREAIAWYEANSGGETHAVGGKAPNAWGLYDMFGNVQEWVQDWYAPDAYSEPGRADPAGPPSGSYKVYRGCGWLSAARYCRPAFRAFDFPNSTHDSVGFRLVRTPNRPR